MDTPRDPKSNEPEQPQAGGLERFEAAAQAAHRAVLRTYVRADEVLSAEEARHGVQVGPTVQGSQAVPSIGDTQQFAAVPVPMEDAAAEAEFEAELRAERAEEKAEEETGKPGRLARSTAFFSIATAASRVAGLAREVVAAKYFGVTGPMSAFTVAFQVPNLIRALFADAALQPAFVPIFTEQLEKKNYGDAFRLASTMIFLVALVLGAIAVIFIAAAGLVMPIFAPGFSEATEDLMVTLSQIMFPILVLLGVTGMVVGILNSYNRFGAFAISPFFWNVTIIAVLIALVPAFPEEDQIYAYAIGIVVGTVVQLAIPAFDLRNTPYRPKLQFDWRDPNVRRVLLLMLPVTISLGLINFNLTINSFFGSLVSDQAPAAIDKAFRIYQLPQGIFSVAIATVLFPTLARYASRGDFDRLRTTMANGMRLIVFILLPATAAILVLSEPMIRLVYERGEFDAQQTELVATALYWFAFSLPTNGLFLLLTRTFFGLQKPWIPTAIAGGNLAVTAIGSAVFYGPFGVGGIVAATALATTASVIAQMVILRGRLGGLELWRLLHTTVRVAAGSVALGALAFGVWDVLDLELGRSLAAQIASLTVGLGVGAAAYVAVCWALRVPELRQVTALVRRRG